MTPASDLGLELDFTGKTVLVTGAANGIGRASAVAFATAGANVLLMDRDAEALEHAEQHLKKMGARAETFQGDLADSQTAVAMVDAALEHFGRLDVLHNNAAWYPKASAVDTAEADWDKTLAVCLTAAFLSVKTALPHMMAQGAGCIINTSSVHAYTAFSGYPAYSAVKAGILGLTRQLAREYGPHNIRVNAVIPGPIDTGIWGQGPEVEARKRARAQTVPLGRIGQPAEVARAVLFLASPLASYITGVSLPVDGGMLIAACEANYAQESEG